MSSPLINLIQIAEQAGFFFLEEYFPMFPISEILRTWTWSWGDHFLIREVERLCVRLSTDSSKHRNLIKCLQITFYLSRCVIWCFYFQTKARLRTPGLPCILQRRFFLLFQIQLDILITNVSPIALYPKFNLLNTLFVLVVHLPLMA